MAEELKQTTGDSAAGDKAAGELDRSEELTQMLRAVEECRRVIGEHPYVLRLLGFLGIHFMTRSGSQR